MTDQKTTNDETAEDPTPNQTRMPKLAHRIRPDQTRLPLMALWMIF
jgi:hypothetical protein